MTTNPKPLRPSIADSQSDGFLDQVIYPDLPALDDFNTNVEQEFLKPYFDRSKKPLKRTLNDIDYSTSDEVLMEKPEVEARPSFDRAKKAAAIKTYEERKADMADLLAETVAETSAAVELEKSMLDNERELQENIRKQKEMEADEEQKRLLEEEEEKLFLKVEELRKESIYKDNKIKELQEIIEIYKRKDDEELAKKREDEERLEREAEMNEQIRQQELEKERLAKEREEMEKAEELERKKLDEKYKEKLEMARINKKMSYDKENLASPSNIMYMNEASNRIPVINREVKPRFQEKIRQFNGVRGNVVSFEFSQEKKIFLI